MQIDQQRKTKVDGDRQTCSQTDRQTDIKHDGQQKQETTGWHEHKDRNTQPVSTN